MAFGGILLSGPELSSPFLVISGPELSSPERAR